MELKNFNTLSRVSDTMKDKFITIFFSNLLDYQSRIYNFNNERFYLETSFTSNSNKSLWFKFCINQGYAISIFKIKNNQENISGRPFFQIEDYVKFRKIDFETSLLWKKFESDVELSHIIESIFSSIEQLLQTSEMQKILFSDIWIDVPIDFSPYN